jgi:hypothetical protein
MSGVESRFGNPEETRNRFAQLANFIPPVALVTLDYPIAGIGTGMAQNARATMPGENKWEAEGEIDRLLIELGPIGFLLVWFARLGLLVALLRAYRMLKKAGRRGASAAALSYAALTMMGNLVFDHVYQALYFTGCGFILSEVASLVRVPGTQAATVLPPPTPADAGTGPPPVDVPATV